MRYSKRCNTKRMQMIEFESEKLYIVLDHSKKEKFILFEIPDRIY